MNSNSAPPLPDELAKICTRMRLPYLRKAAPDVLATARAQRWDPAEVVRVLLQEEVVGRDAATFADAPQEREILNRQDVLVVAPGGVLDSRGHPERAHHARMGAPPGEPGRVRSIRDGEESFRRSARARGDRGRPAGAVVHPRNPHPNGEQGKADGSVARTVAKVCSCDLVVVDDIGMLPAGQDAAEAFYRIVDAAYERRSVAVTSNIHPSGFDTIMPKTLATATVDRLLHHAHVIVTKGDSHRLADALAGKGVHPLD